MKFFKKRRYSYFVSFAHNVDGVLNFGQCDVDCFNKINNGDLISDLRKNLEHDLNLSNLRILNFIYLGRSKRK